MQEKSGYILLFCLMVLFALGTLVAYLRLQTKETTKIVEKALAEREFSFSSQNFLSFCIKSVPTGSEKEDFTFECQLGSYRGELYFSYENQRLNLNKASYEEIKEKLLALGFKEEQASLISYAIIDWRDKDSFPGLLGAEDPYYQKLGYEAKDAPFESFSELCLVRGLDPYLVWLSPGLYKFFSFWSQIMNQPEEVVFGQGLWRVEAKVYHRGFYKRYLAILDFHEKGFKFLYFQELPH